MTTPEVERALASIREWVEQNSRSGSGEEIGTDERVVDADELLDVIAGLTSA